MKEFIRKSIWFITPLILMVLLGLVVPATPRASKSLLFSATKKDFLLQNAPSPRIIFVGGSNLSFGLNSKIIKESLHMNPINTAIHISIGLKFMMDNTLQYVKKGDVIVLIPEYSHFYRDINLGSEELLRTIFDVKFSDINLLSYSQLFNLMPFIPKYAISKYKFEEYVNVKDSDIYSVDSFNEFGDVYTHWNMGQRDFHAYGKIDGQFQQSVIKRINEFNLAIMQKGASLYISYPGFQANSFDNSIAQIKKIEHELGKLGVTILGTPERYKLPDSLMFNTPYHLNKKGVDYRTRLFIEDFNIESNLANTHPIGQKL